MTTNKTIAQEYGRLVNEIYSLSFDVAIDKLNSFFDQYKNDCDEKPLRHQINYLKGDLLEKKGNLNEALSIYTELLSEKALDDGLYSTILTKIATILIQLGKKEEALMLVDEYLEKKQNYWNHTLPLLRWFVDNLENQYEQLQKYANHVEWIRKELEIETPSSALRDVIIFLSNENNTANRKYSKLILSFKGLSREEKIKLLNEYITNEPVGYYRNLAQKNILELQSPGT